MLLLVLFVSVHSPTFSQFRTHSKQYLWMTTAAFLRGWAPVLIILLAIGGGEVLVSMVCAGSQTSNMSSQSDTMLSRMQWCRSILLYSSVHLLNIVGVVTANSAYVYATVNGLPSDQLFGIQLSLGCFKLVWNGIAIPWFLKFSLEENNLATHRVFMSLFAFIGGPLISTFFTASNCFLYIVTPQSSLTSTVVVPQYSCASICSAVCAADKCKFYCPSKCQFQPGSITTTSLSSWIYSYQCSSSLLLNYVPVMIASMAVSGFILPCLVLSQFAFKKGVVISLLASLAPRSMSIGDAFDVNHLSRFLLVKTLVNLTIMLTFGFASPLLGVLVVLDSTVWSGMRQVLVRRQIDHLKSSSNAMGINDSCSDVKDSGGLNSIDKTSEVSILAKKESYSPFHCLMVLSFVSVFWSLFMFDMIGDVYGDLAGGLSMLAPLLLAAVIWLAMKYRRKREQMSLISKSATIPGIEFSDLFAENPFASK